MVHGRVFSDGVCLNVKCQSFICDNKNFKYQQTFGFSYVNSLPCFVPWFAQGSLGTVGECQCDPSKQNHLQCDYCNRGHLDIKLTNQITGK